MLDESQDQPAGQPSSRARRIRDEEWEAYRPTIEKLYRDQGSSRSSVIEKLKQDGFIVTEKQLKHILKKWSIKKNISRTDLGIMLATKRRRNNDGKATQFAYHGHAVNEEKLLRAAKRLKTPGPFSTAMPSYIETFSPNPSNGSPLLGQATALAGFETPNNEHSPSGLSHASILWDSLFQNSSLFTPVQQDFAFDPNDADLGLAPFENGEEASWNTQSTDSTLSGDVSLHYSNDFSLSMLNNNGFAGSFWADPPANNYDSMVDTSQNLFVPPVPRTSNNLASRTVLSTPVPNSIIASPPITTLNLGEPSSGLDLQSSLDHSLEKKIPSNKVLFYGTNPENIIPTVQMMMTLVRRCQDESFLYSHLFSRGPFQRKLVDEIQSEILRSEIDDVAFWAYQASAKFIRHQRTVLQVADAEFVVSPGHYEDQDPMSQIRSGSLMNNTKCSKIAGALASYCNIRTNCTTGGTFQIQLRQTPKKTSDNENDIPYYIVVSAIPEVRTRTEAGVRVTFPRKAQVLPIYTTIRTFNVVPKDSEIIKCVSMNDLEGVRKLIRENKASPRDVDPLGSSLLFYAVFSGFSDIFRLLLEGGASTDHFYLFGQLGSLIDCVWEYHVEIAIALGGYAPGFPTMKFISDIDQCRSMTEIALANGCLVEDSVPQNGDTPTPLFMVSQVFKQESTARQFATTVQQLLAAGYDKEFRNFRGQTPLLYAAFSPGWRSLTTLKLLLAEETDIHAVDSNGRDTLRLCFCFTESLYHKYLEVCRGSIWARREQFIDENIAVREALSDRNREEDAYYDVASSDQESDVSFAGYKDDDSFSTPDNAVQSRECYWCGDIDIDIDYYGVDEPSLLDYCEARDVDDFNMPSDTSGDHEYPDIEPEPWMCRARLRLKLFVLLQAGCDPNTRDSGGASPSDYARKEGLWPQWEWALAESGWKYNEEIDLCDVKDVMP